ncbi:NAD(P)-dependent oxidoreductase [Cryptosporangium japonicum]|uniref:NAD(P)-binding domain-containing protein n=1 Tax=Cryptosporangium japonicum TaxID=80872 RepID=A0ABP3E758_9ACTN
MSTTFLGLGEMGRALAATTSAAGEPVTVWNRSAGRAHPMAGVAVADSVPEALSGGGAIVVCLFDHASVHEVLDPVASALPGRTLINLTTTTPDEARELAARYDATYLQGAIMAVPAMIGGPASQLFYSGSAAAYERHRALLDRWGSSTYFGADAGLASVYDMAMLTGMYTMIGGFLQGAAMLAAEGVSASAFTARQAPFLAAMAGQLAGYAATVDDRDYAGPGQQSLRFTDAALGALRRASVEQGVGADVLAPVHELVRRQIDAGFGDHGTARLYESLRSTR